ncbi:MAG: hypothetical protein KJ709_02795 [Nanoarchaeota archaeon]|nr:hypothetical protein [Nanoarchaeota archaeon]
MILDGFKELEEKIKGFDEYSCIVIICRYNGGKSSVITEMIHRHFGEENIAIAVKYSASLRAIVSIKT